jgi:eukaryotic-like serine/threonine-protein kinase
MPHHTPLRAGDPRRIGRYRLTGRLTGTPADNPVFIGVGSDGLEVLVRMLRGDWAQDAAARDRFAAEAAVAKRVPPFCAARVLDAGVDGADAYLVSEYVPGQSLLEVVASDGVRRDHDLAAVAIGMATGLASVHQAGLVHGNFGPEHVIITSDASPRVVEFGITPPYGEATPAADMLAWAKAVLFAASGRSPAGRRDLDILPDHIRRPVERCLDPDPSGRPASRAVVMTLLGDVELPAGVLAEGSRRARPASPAVPDQRRSVRRGPPGSGRRTGWLVAGALLVLVLVGAALQHIVQDSGSKSGSGSLSANTGQDTSQRSTPSATPAKRPTTPAAFAGFWSGQVKQPKTDAYNVSVTLARGANSGTVSYSGADFSCSGAVSLTQTTRRRLRMSQRISHGSCADGHVTIWLTSSDTIWFSFTSNGPTARGTLTRS